MRRRIWTRSFLRRSQSVDATSYAWSKGGLEMGRPRSLMPAMEAEIWRLWKAGESLARIARVLGQWETIVHSIVDPTGGICPKARVRSPRALSMAEREEISLGICANRSIREIARRLGRQPSSISREISRNGGLRRYRAHKSRQVCLEPRAAPEALPSGPKSAGRAEAAGGLVTAADCRLA